MSSTKIPPRSNSKRTKENEGKSSSLIPPKMIKREVPSPPPSAYPSSLGVVLYEQVNLGICVDMKFLAGKDKTEVPAQRNILFAKSPKLKMELDARKDATIDVTNFSASSVKAFVKSVFLDSFDSEIAQLDLNILVEVYSLIRRYEISNLKIAITSIITKKITLSNCIQVLQDAEFNRLPEEMAKTAWRFFKWNLPFLLVETDIPSSFMYWNKETWAKVFSLEGIETFLTQLKEEQLFLQFSQWKPRNPNLTEDDVNELVRLIRFPLMTEGFLSSVVESSGLLSDSDLLDLLLYTKDDNQTGRIPSFPRSKRSYKLVKAPKDLDTHLIGSQPGDCINLEGTIEFGESFKTNLKKVTIKGRDGMDAKLKFYLSSGSCNNGDPPASLRIFYLEGDDMTLTNLEFVASDPRIRWEVVIDGKRNVLSNLKFRGCALRIRGGKYNQITDISFVGDAGGKSEPVLIIDVDDKDTEQKSGWNTVHGITFKNVTHKIQVHEKSVNNKINI